MYPSTVGFTVVISLYFPFAFHEQVQPGRAPQRPDPYLSQRTLGSGALSVVRSEESLELSLESPTTTMQLGQLGQLEQLGLSSTLEVEADCSKCSKSIESMGTDEECNLAEGWME